MRMTGNGRTRSSLVAHLAQSFGWESQAIGRSGLSWMLWAPVSVE
jgi:hypothetical protein